MPEFFTFISEYFSYALTDNSAAGAQGARFRIIVVIPTGGRLALYVPAGQEIFYVVPLLRDPRKVF